MKSRPLVRAVEAAALDVARLLGGALVPGGEVRGEHRGTEVVVRWQLLQAPAVSHGRVVTVEGASGLEIANLVVVCWPRLLLPIFGVDLVSVRPGDALVVVDASPVVDAAVVPRPSGSSLPLEPLGHPLPAWFERWRSADALVGRARIPEQVEALAEALRRRAVGFAESVNAARPVDDADLVQRARASQAAYARDHRQDDRGLLLLDKLVGREQARRIVDEVMFPQPPQPAIS